jgi:hypothetical protein
MARPTTDNSRKVLFTLFGRRRGHGSLTTGRTRSRGGANRWQPRQCTPSLLCGASAQIRQFWGLQRELRDGPGRPLGSAPVSAHGFLRRTAPLADGPLADRVVHRPGLGALHQGDRSQWPTPRERVTVLGRAGGNVALQTRGPAPAASGHLRERRPDAAGRTHGMGARVPKGVRGRAHRAEGLQKACLSRLAASATRIEAQAGASPTRGTPLGLT